MNFENNYYDNEEIWKLESTRECDIERIDFISELVPKQIHTVLDVGCGNGVFLSSLKTKTDLILFGTDRSKSALKHLNTNKLLSSCESLPFNDNTFDLITSLEVIEHLPNSVYEKSLEEFCRISKKYIIISVPNDEDLEKRSIKCPSCKSIFHRNFHYRSFTLNEMSKLLDKFNFKCSSVHFVGIQYEFLFVDYKKISFGKKNSYSNTIYNPISCPICGYHLERNVSNSKHHSNSLIKLIKEMLIKILPKRLKYRWIVGVYEKK
jgi:ubiquinone/menaquinone biosynthesis C-methylase UbiE